MNETTIAAIQVAKANAEASLAGLLARKQALLAELQSVDASIVQQEYLVTQFTEDIPE